MMAFTTLIISVPILFILHYSFFKRIKRPAISYTILGIVGVAFMLTKAVHLIYVGLEIIIIGVIIVYLKNKYTLKNSTKL